MLRAYLTREASKTTMATRTVSTVNTLLRETHGMVFPLTLHLTSKRYHIYSFGGELMTL